MTTFAHQGNGKLVKGPGGKLAKDCECCTESCPDVVCTGTDGVGWRIVDYADGMIDASCVTGACASEPTWDGTFTWKRNPCEYRMAANRCIDGKVSKYNEGTPTAISLLFDGDGNAYYDIRITAGGTRTTLWGGQKYCGDTFAGVYTQTNGCSSGPSTIEIEENV